LGPGERLEQRAEEEALVDGPDGRLMPAKVGLEVGERGRLRVVAITHDPSQPAPRGGIGRQGVDLLVLDQLQAVLRRPEEAVSGLERRVVLRGDVPGLSQVT